MTKNFEFDKMFSKLFSCRSFCAYETVSEAVKINPNTLKKTQIVPYGQISLNPFLSNDLLD